MRARGSQRKEPLQACKAVSLALTISNIEWAWPSLSGQGISTLRCPVEKFEIRHSIFDIPCLPPLNRLFIDLKHFGSVDQPILVGLLLKVDS